MSTLGGTVPTQFVSTTGPRATPVGYVVPGSQEIQLSSVSAEFDGSGAGGDFYPTLSLYSKDNKLISRTRVGSTVTAGDSAVCTWIPFLRQAAAVTPTGTVDDVFANMYGASLNAVADSTETTVTGYGSAEAFDPSVIATDTTTGIMTVKVVGWYLVQANLIWPAFAGDRYLTFQFSGPPINFANVPAVARDATSPDGNVQTVQAFFLNNANTNSTVRVRAYQASGLSQTPSKCEFSVLKIADGFGA